MQCQVVARNALKLSPNSDINLLWSSSSVGCNIQYDQFRNTKQVLNAIQNDKENRIHLYILRSRYDNELRTMASMRGVVRFCLARPHLGSGRNFSS